MGKKSKKRNKGSVSSAVYDDPDDVYKPNSIIDKIAKEASELCPDAKDSYSVSLELFDNELWNEIQTYWLEPGSTLSKDKVWKLVSGVRLVSLKTLTITDKDVIDDSDVEAAEELELVYTTPYQLLEKKFRYGSGPQHVHQYWSVRWLDIIPGYNQTNKGDIICSPFFIDPTFHSTNPNGKRGWNLEEHSDNPVAIQCMRLGYGYNATDVSVKDIARCIIPTIGILGKYHPGNRNHILQRTMLRLERQVRTWNVNDKPDPTFGSPVPCQIVHRNIHRSDPMGSETSDNLHRRGGVLTHPTVKEELLRESRWLAGENPCSWWHEVSSVPSGAVDCCTYRDEDGYQHKLLRMDDGTTIDEHTNSKKGVGGSERDFMAAMVTKTAFFDLSIKDVQETGFGIIEEQMKSLTISR